MRQRALRALLVAGLVVVTFVLLAFFGGFVYVSAASTAASAQYQYGSDTVVVGTPATPTCLNPLRASCGMTPAWTAGGIALEGAFRLRPDFTYESRLVESVDVQTRTKKRPFALTYHIRPEAVWSDEVPVSADDFVFTYEVIVDPANQEIADRSGYDRIADAVVVDAKTVRFVFTEPWGAWRTLFSTVLPKHVLEGHDFDQAWSNEIADPDTHEPIGSGPFLVTGFTGGFPSWLTLSRNSHWWGAQPALEAVVIRFANGLELVQELHEGDVDVLSIGVVPGIEQLQSNPGLVTEVNPGNPMEHLDFNLGSTTMPLLAHEWFRRAVARSIDRTAVAASVTPAAPGLDPLQNLMYLEQHTGYEPNFDKYDYNPAKVAALMTDNGCTLGGDDIWSCGTRASIKFATTTGNPRRAAAQSQMQAQAAAAGIELVQDNSSPGVLFGTPTTPGRLQTGNYELAMFAWVVGPDPFTGDTVYGCGGVSNFKHYCSPSVDDLLTKSDAEVDPKKRAKLVNKTDAQLADDVPTIPLFQVPLFLAFRTAVHGPVDNIVGGPTWNVETWSKD